MWRTNSTPNVLCHWFGAPTTSTLAMKKAVTFYSKHREYCIFVFVFLFFTPWKTTQSGGLFLWPLLIKLVINVSREQKFVFKVCDNKSGLTIVWKCFPVAGTCFCFFCVNLERKEDWQVVLLSKKCSRQYSLCSQSLNILVNWVNKFTRYVAVYVIGKIWIPLGPLICVNLK